MGQQQPTISLAAGATLDFEAVASYTVAWRRTSYTLGTTVGDGTHTSAVQGVQVIIPNRVKLCLLRFINLEVPKVAAPVLILLGGTIGSCSTP